MMKVPLSVIRGKSPINVSCSLISPVSLFISLTFNFKGTEYVASLSLHSTSLNLGSPYKEWSTNSRIKLPV